MLDFMEKNAGPLKNLHLIGNNLGAHVMGVAAGRTRVVRVPRITGERAERSTFQLGVLSFFIIWLLVVIHFVGADLWIWGFVDAVTTGSLCVMRAEKALSVGNNEGLNGSFF
jgi:hypothetical protein